MAASGKYTASTVFKAVDKYTNPVKVMSKTTGNFATKAQAGLLSVERSARRLNKTTNVLSRSLKGMVAGIGLTVAIQGAATAAITLDKNLSAAAAKFQIFDRESETYIKLEKTARAFGATTEFTAGQAAEGLEKLGVAGFKADQAIASLGTVLNLATATQTEFGVAADVSAKSLAAFGLKSKDPLKLAENLEVASDVLNRIITTSGFGQLDQFLDVLATSGSSARAAGVDIQTWGAIVAGSVSEAVPASRAGTRFANMLSFMTKKTKGFNKIGVQLKDTTTGNFRDIIDILEDVQAQTQGMDKFDRMGLFLKLFGERGSKMAASLMENGIPALRAYKQEIVDSTGQTKKMATFMRSGLSGVSKSLVSALEEIGISLESTFRTEIRDSIKGITTVARETGTWINENKRLIKTVATGVEWFVKAKIAIFGVQKAAMLLRGTMVAYNVVAAVNAVITGKSVFQYRRQASAMIAARGAATALSVATKAMQGPIGWITLGVAAATLGIIAYSKATQSAEKTARKFGASIQKNIFTETRKLDDYFEQLKRTNPESEKRKKLLEEMHSIFPDILKDYDLQKAKLEEIETAQKKSTAALREQIILEATAAKKKEILASSIEKQATAVENLFNLGLSEAQVSEATALADKGKLRASDASVRILANRLSGGAQATSATIANEIARLSGAGQDAVSPKIEAIEAQSRSLMNIPADLEGAGIVSTNSTSTQNQKIDMNFSNIPSGAEITSTGDKIVDIPTPATTGEIN